ncbi:MAG: type II toxin-antitoxin system RelE/ParE family toxin [Actinomycetia bacterium]|nr:type II toxin-antitoxin system RelE/ParE family toxin [Actinomycetes bacterium]
MRFTVLLIQEAKKDFEKLDGSIKKQILKKLILLETNPFLGKPLGNRAGMDLIGYYKLYVYKRKIRIIYEIQDEALIIRVISIGKREDFTVYLQAFLRKGKNR